MNNIDRLIQIMKQAGIQVPDTVNPDAELSDIGLDSLDTYNFFVEIETELGINVPDEELDNLKTLSLISAYIDKNMPE